MVIRRRMVGRLGVILVALGLSVWLGSGGVLSAPEGDNAADPDMFLISFHGSADRALVDEYGGEVRIMYPFASKINVWITPEAAEALGGHEAVDCVDQRQLFFIGFEEVADLALVEEYGGEVYGQMTMLPIVDAFMSPEAAEMLAEHPAVRHVEPDWPAEPAEDDKSCIGGRA